MGEIHDDPDFRAAVMEQLARIDERTHAIQEELRGLRGIHARLATIEARAKSNTHRIDGIYKSAALLAMGTSALINFASMALRYFFGNG